MGKLILFNMMTLDGYFEGENKWDLSFHELVWGRELARTLRSIRLQRGSLQVESAEPEFDIRNDGQGRRRPEG